MTTDKETCPDCGGLGIRHTAVSRHPYPCSTCSTIYAENRKPKEPVRDAAPRSGELIDKAAVIALLQATDAGDRFFDVRIAPFAGWEFRGDVCRRADYSWTQVSEPDYPPMFSTSTVAALTLIPAGCSLAQLHDDCETKKRPLVHAAIRRDEPNYAVFKATAPTYALAISIAALMAMPSNPRSANNGD